MRFFNKNHRNSRIRVGNDVRVNNLQRPTPHPIREMRVGDTTWPRSPLPPKNADDTTLVASSTMLEQWRFPPPLHSPLSAEQSSPHPDVAVVSRLVASAVSTSGAPARGKSCDFCHLRSSDIATSWITRNISTNWIMM